MSIAETIQQRIEKMSEQDQLRLLEYVNHITFHQEDVSESDKEEYDQLLKEFLVKRYQYAKAQAHPEKAITAEEAALRIRLKYGWNG